MRESDYCCNIITGAFPAFLQRFPRRTDADGVMCCLRAYISYISKIEHTCQRRAFVPSERLLVVPSTKKHQHLPGIESKVLATLGKFFDQETLGIVCCTMVSSLWSKAPSTAVCTGTCMICMLRRERTVDTAVQQQPDRCDWNEKMKILFFSCSVFVTSQVGLCHGRHNRSTGIPVLRRIRWQLRNTACVHRRQGTNESLVKSLLRPDRTRRERKSVRRRRCFFSVHT